jgi:hypothetical protein
MGTTGRELKGRVYPGPEQPRGCAVQDVNLPAENQAVEVPSASPHCPLTEEEWADSIRSDLVAGATHHISAGRKLIQAKKDLKKHGGSFINLVEVKLGWNLDTVEKWMAIAGNPVLADSATLRNLPSYWTTLYALSRLPPKMLERCIKDGTIHPQLTYKVAVALVRRARGSNSDGASSTEAGLSTETAATAAAEQKAQDVPTICGSDIPATHDEAIQAAAQKEEIGPNSRGEIERKLARLEELEREKAQWEIQRHGYEREVEELKAKLGPETDIHCQRRLFQRALRALQKSETPHTPETEKRSLANSAMTDLIELARSAVRDGLRVERLDLIYRPEAH